LRYFLQSKGEEWWANSVGIIISTITIMIQNTSILSPSWSWS
jgi:hypothetical protein